MRRLSNVRNIEEVSSERGVPDTNKIFYDEYLIRKTTTENYELIIILRPKDLACRGYYFQSSEEPGLVQYTFSNKLFSIINHYLAQNESVKKILFLQEDNVLRIWTAISNYDVEDNRTQIYKKEAELTKFLSRTGFHFDFYLIEPEEVNDVLSSGAVIIYDKTQSS